MANFNKVILVGNLTRDPELRYTPKGTAVARITLAVNRTWKSESGENKEEVSFVDVDVWGRQAEVISQYMKKGRPLLVEGRLKQDTWEDKNTKQKQSKLKVVLESFSFIDSTRASTSAGERDGQLIDLAVEGKRHVIIAIIDGRAGIRPNIEGFIPGKGERDRAIHHVRRDDFAIDPQRSGSRATKPADIVEGERRKPQPVIFEVIRRRMLTRRKRLGRLPFHPFQVEQVPGEDRSAL